jgi:hypothetical protein
MSWPRTILALSRPARLPSIWSNCLAGWWLGGGGNMEQLPFLFGGASFLYLGGVFLNDAFDAEYDRQHRRARPIAAGSISHDAVWRWGLTWLVIGALLLLAIGRVAGNIALGLVFLNVVYNAIHRLVTFSPVLKGMCRCLLYPLGASAAEHGITGWSLWCGLALGSYVTGAAYFSRWEETPRQARAWPVALLSAPIFLALLMDANGYREPALLLCGLLVLLGLLAFRQAFWSLEREIQKTVGLLFAGVVFVDWLSACPVASVIGQSNHAPRELSLIFIGLFLGTLLLQKLAPEV